MTIDERFSNANRHWRGYGIASIVTFAIIVGCGSGSGVSSRLVCGDDLELSIARASQNSKTIYTYQFESTKRGSAIAVEEENGRLVWKSKSPEVVLGRSPFRSVLKTSDSEAIFYGSADVLRCVRKETR